jgi:3-dehydroquinate dehydratase
LEIKNHVDVEKNFEFQHITSDKIEKIIDKINIKKVLNFSETSHVSFIILLSSHRIIFRSPELHLLEKNGLTVFQKLTFLAPPVQRSRTDKIGEDIVYDPATHPSIVEIKNHVDVEKNVEFQHITSDKIEKIIDKINIKKAS